MQLGFVERHASYSSVKALGHTYGDIICVSPASSIGLFSACSDVTLNVRWHVSECKRFHWEPRAHSWTHCSHSSMHVARRIAPHVASANASTERRGEQRFSRMWSDLSSDLHPSVKALLSHLLVIRVVARLYRPLSDSVRAIVRLVCVCLYQWIR